MLYTITGNEDEGYTLTHKTGAIKYSLCPCCNKKIATHSAAEAIANALTAIEELPEAFKQ